MSDDIFMQYLFNFLPKDRVFKDRNDPYNELTDEEFRKRFRLSKIAVSLVLMQVKNDALPAGCLHALHARSSV